MDIEGTRSTPSVHIEPGKIEIKGRSIPEDSFDFYNPVVSAIKDYFEAKEQNTQVDFHLEYINSGSKKFITNILHYCDQCYLNGKNIKINWYYDSDDESIQELGNDLRTMIKIPFLMIEVK